eukprot:scaffold45506_cov23-Cyclotella_meneghiniana.AAC.1
MSLSNVSFMVCHYLPKRSAGLKTQTSALEAEIKSIQQKIAGTLFTQSVGYDIDKCFPAKQRGSKFTAARKK